MADYRSQYVTFFLFFFCKHKACTIELHPKVTPTCTCIKCIFRTLKPGVTSDDCPNTQSPETQRRNCADRQVFCTLPDTLSDFSFKTCNLDLHHTLQSDDNCKIIGPHQKRACSRVDGREICIQDCNPSVPSEGCKVLCYNPKIDIGGVRPVCTGCKNGQVKMESQDDEYNITNYVITCEQNGEEKPGDFVCEEECGCEHADKSTTGTFKLIISINIIKFVIIMFRLNLVKIAISLRKKCGNF